MCVQQQEVVNTRLLSIYTAKLLLKDTSCMEFCLNLLQALLRNQDSLQPADVCVSMRAERHGSQGGQSSKHHASLTVNLAQYY